MKKFDSFRTRSFRIGGYSVVAALIVLAVLIAVNMIVNALPYSATKLDATASKLYSLSDQTKSVLKTLDEDVTIYWICQEGIEDVALETLIGHYTSSSAHIKVQKVDPDVNPAFVEKYTTELYNNSVVISSAQRDRYISNEEIYVLDTATYYASGEEEWTFEGEDALTRGIYYVVTDKLPKVYVTSGHGEATLSDAQQNLFLDENLELATLKLVSFAAIPEDADLVMIYLPTTDISEGEKTVLQNYMADGGKVMLVTMPTGVDMPNLEAVMSVYGISVVDGYVMEGDASRYSQAPFYLLPTINSHEITDPVINNKLYALTYAAQGLQVQSTGSTTQVVTQLLTTSDSSYSKVNMQSTTAEKEAGDISGPFCVGVAVEDAATGAQAVWYTSEYALQSVGANVDLFFNAINWMCEQEEMIAIRGKSASQEYLTMDKDSANAISWIIVGFIPLGYLAVGINTYVRRKRR